VSGLACLVTAVTAVCIRHTGNLISGDERHTAKNASEPADYPCVVPTRKARPVRLRL